MTQWKNAIKTDTGSSQVHKEENKELPELLIEINEVSEISTAAKRVLCKYVDLIQCN